MSKKRKHRPIASNQSISVDKGNISKSGKRGLVKASVFVVILLTALVAFGSFASWRRAETNPATARSPVASAPLPTPHYAANAPAKEYLYAGSKLLAVSEPVQSAPTDLAVWRPGNGTWYIYGTQTTQAWGLPGDIPVPGDYDGDEKTDFSVFRPSTNRWYIMYSSNSYFFDFEFGLTGDKTAQADYDGDGKTDAAVFRPSNSTWYIQRSSLGYYERGWGLSGDIPASADYDGDGKAELGVWRNGESKFYSLRIADELANVVSMSGVSLSQCVGCTVSADYDGDGRADHAIFDNSPSISKWHIRNSSTGLPITVDWGLVGDWPVQNDYDADGKVDIATWRDSNANWYIRQTASGDLLRIPVPSWGLSGDYPVPAFYRR